ncbi:ABC transporter substrate-binding protein [Rhodococcus artemisiae]|uniref:ABC transporter substrate-binding protein n=2 Tax=Rhodococcus artemisiae TaxID=714159 RepID=A0ABU7L771_9NOCA|nr:ABC transporter substrate-binding protein [Rhodococcus artemisiae]MEE2056757.1 ABC transporter substrate-binding protein [Rhodococcus artemisiae]
MKRSTASKLVAGLAATMAVTSACASDRGPDSSFGGLAPVAAAEAAAAPSEVKFGTLESPCGAGDAVGATDQGVTDTEIRIGFGDDSGYVKSPGLNKEMGDAVAAMIDWCNEQGGINGRQITGTYYDGAMTQANAVMQNACGSEFMMVGHGFAMDQTSEQTRVACNLAAVPAFTVSPDAANGPMTYQGVPFPVDYANGSQWFQIAEMYPDLLNDFDVIDSTMPTIITSTNKIRSIATAAGFNLKNCGVTLNYEGESSYVPFAEKFKECGVKGLWTSRSPVPAEFNLVKAFDQVGIDPIFMGEATWYGDAAREWNGANGGLLDNLNAGMTFQMIENADTVPAVKDYVDVVSEQGGKTALLGMQATSSFLLWATAARECGSDLTRQCMIDELSEIHEWDGGGLHAVTDPGANMPAKCGLVTTLEGTEFSQAFPTEAGTFKCDDSYLIATDASTWGTDLGPDRIATKYLNPNIIRPAAS